MVITREHRRASIWTALVLLGSLVCGFGLVTLLLTHNHSWTDALLRRLPSPGGRSSLAAGAGLIAQMRTKNAAARLAHLSDKSTALIVRSDVVNESMIPVSNIVVEAVVLTDNHRIVSARSQCGKVVSETLLNRLPRDELDTLLEVPVPSDTTLAPGATLQCQIALPGIGEAADEVEFRVASVEPFPGHPRPSLGP